MLEDSLFTGVLRHSLNEILPTLEHKNSLPQKYLIATQNTVTAYRVEALSDLRMLTDQASTIFYLPLSAGIEHLYSDEARFSSTACLATIVH